MASGTLRCGWRASPARSMAVRNPSRLKRIPPLPMAFTTPLRLAPATERSRLRLLQWPAATIRLSDTSSGTTNFQLVSPSIQRASQLTPARLIQAINTNITAATPMPAALSTCPWPPSAVSQGMVLATYSTIANTSIVGRVR